MNPLKITWPKKFFDLLYRKGKSANGKFFYLKYLTNRKKEEPTKITIIVSTKVSKKAVVRNRKKRQLREIIRLNKPKIKNGFSILLVAKEDILNADYRDLEGEFLFLIKKTDIYLDNKENV